MTITEKVAYLKGLMEGLEIDETSKEGKIFKAILDVLDDMALTVEDLDSSVDELSDMVDALDEDLGTVEEDLYGTDEDDEDDEDEDDDFEEGDEELDLDGAELYEVTCPSCGETFNVSEETLDAGETKCPSCGQALEFDLDIGEDGEDTPIQE